MKWVCSQKNVVYREKGKVYRTDYSFEFAGGGTPTATVTISEMNIQVMGSDSDKTYETGETYVLAPAGQA